MIFVNFKIYPSTFSHQAVNLVKIIKEVSVESSVKIIPIVSSLDAVEATSQLPEVFIQHIDEYLEGPFTGRISSLHAASLGLSGALINHSEYRQKPGTIKKIIKSLPKNFQSIVCLQTINQAITWGKFIKPSFIAYEPTALIGSKTESVATKHSDAIKKFVNFYPNIPIIVGAGIHSVEDVKISLSSGAKGILVASDIITSSDPKKELLDLALAFRK